MDETQNIFQGRKVLQKAADVTELGGVESGWKLFHPLTKALTLTISPSLFIFCEVL